MDRTVGNNRLIDGEKLDRLVKNGSGKISMTSMIDGSVTDQDILDLIEAGGGGSGTPTAPPTAPVEKNDIQATTGTVVTLDVPNKLITLTFPDGTYTRYSEHGYTEYTADGVIITTFGINGVWAVGDHTTITYVDDTIVNIDGIGSIKVGGSNVAYINKSNTFTKPQKFKEQAIFDKTVVSNFEDSAVYVGSTITLDMRNGNSRKIVLTKNTNLKLNYLDEGGVYNVFVVKNGFNVRLTGVSKTTVSSTGVISTVALTNGTYWVGSVLPAILEDGVTTPVVTISGIVGDSAMHLTAMGTGHVNYPTSY